MFAMMDAILITGLPYVCSDVAKSKGGTAVQLASIATVRAGVDKFLMLAPSDDWKKNFTPFRRECNYRASLQSHDAR
jgi:hypothetical protein